METRSVIDAGQEWRREREMNMFIKGALVTDTGRYTWDESAQR